MSATLHERAVVAANEDERSALTAIGHLLGGPAPQRPLLVGPDGEQIEVPESLVRVLRQAAPLLLAEHAVTIMAVHKELTTQEAADLLNVSRPHLIKVLDEGKIPYTRTGTHRRIRFDDLVAYKERRGGERRRALAELTRMSYEMGLYK